MSLHLPANRLTDLKIKGSLDKAHRAFTQGQPHTPQKLSDGGSMYLYIKPNGRAYWRLNYRVDGKLKTISLGTYPKISLKDARQQRDHMRAELEGGVDPAVIRKASKHARVDIQAFAFEIKAREWFERKKKRKHWSQTHATRVIQRLEKRAFPFIGNKPVQDVTPDDIEGILLKIQKDGAIETAHRAKSDLLDIFKLARISPNPVDALPPDLLDDVINKQLPAITDVEGIGSLLRAISGYRGNPEVRYALQLLPYVFVRMGELRKSEWEHIDVDAGIWTFPARNVKGTAKRKATGPDLVFPLSAQAISIIEELRPHTGHEMHVFHSGRTKEGVISDAAVNAALKRLGYANKHTSHSFRSMASTTLNESGLFHPDAIETQLSHLDRSSVRAAYNRATYVDERRKMLVWLANRYDELRGDA